MAELVAEVGEEPVARVAVESGIGSTAREIGEAGVGPRRAGVAAAFVEERWLAEERGRFVGGSARLVVVLVGSGKRGGRRLRFGEWVALVVR